MKLSAPIRRSRRFPEIMWRISAVPGDSRNSKNIVGLPNIAVPGTSGSRRSRRFPAGIAHDRESLRHCSNWGKAIPGKSVPGDLKKCRESLRERRSRRFRPLTPYGGTGATGNRFPSLAPTGAGERA